jgi:hypothetical protein
MRIVGILLMAVALVWLTLEHFAFALPMAGNYSMRLQKLPVQDSYTRQQVRDIVWEVSAFRWSFPDQQTYSRKEVTNILRTASMNKQARDGTAPSVFAPVLLLLVGVYVLGVSIGNGTDVKPAT